MMMRVSALVVLIVAVTCAFAHAHTDLTPVEVMALLESGGNIVVIDVREESEFCDTQSNPPGHIPDAINMPWNSGYLQEHYGELSPSDSTIVVCRSGNRSNIAANFLDSVGFTNVFDMLGGMLAWQWETALCESSSIPGSGATVTAGLFLGAASPSPFTSRTEIPFEIPAGQGPTRVKVSVYDAGGRLVTTIVDADRSSGSHRVVWDGRDSRGRPVTSGVFYYQLAWNDQSVTRRVVLLR